MSSTIKAIQSLSALMEAGALFAALLKLAIEAANGERGLVLLGQASGDAASYRIQAEAVMGLHGVEFLSQTGAEVIAERLAQSLLEKVAGSHAMTLLDDAAMGEFAKDPYLLAARPKSVCCLPLVTRGGYGEPSALFGVLYLESKQGGVFAPDRIDVLEALIAQAEISWQNLALYNGVKQENAEYRRAAAREEPVYPSGDTLQKMQEQLVDAEKMAALGCLVASVAHEINTPVGVGVTAASSLQGAARHLARLYCQGKMKKVDLERFLEESEETSQMILENLQRASDLIHSFKQVAVDQASEAKRDFNVKGYLNEILTSLTPKLKTTALRCEIECFNNIEMISYPGAFSQIVSNLIMNAIMHAYEPGQAGLLRICVTQEDRQVKLLFIDDGKGIAPENIERIYEPFFTTRRGSGGSGLGLSIVRKLVSQSLQGSITCHSEIGKGTVFVIYMALEV